MLSTNLLHLAIEPVTTTVGLIALGKALGLFGAAAGGSIAGKYAAGHKGEKALKEGMNFTLANIRLAEDINDRASQD
ncbi:hypothetical protein [Dolichospermum flos-aquae]|jgi:hypothetical protein|uniref:Uncharacterized protein n=1 Tax=Dolichospermum flos-aquae CCAP 1403/13F TaxID=315271 RepID=A0A6H2BWN0_DOLFA|nr:hypothetical protein [Dolichospermum flos-aquae]QJB43376.1 hypothetical protein HGD76_03190 [Dolichospermum flos-aquae CCAP 1403/13F]